MPVSQFPTSGTQQYASGAEVLFALTEWFIATGLFEEVDSSNGTTYGSTGNILSASDFNNNGAYRILEAADGHQVAWQRATSGNWRVLVAQAPGFVTGGDATTIPTAALELEIYGTRATPLSAIWSIGSQYWYFWADDTRQGLVSWGVYSPQSGGTARFGVMRTASRGWAPNDSSDTDRALYFRVDTNATQQVRWWDRDDGARTDGTTRPMFAATPGASAGGLNFFAPVLWEQGTPVYYKGPPLHYRACNTNSNAEQLLQCDQGWFVTYNGRAWFLGENQPTIPGVSSAGIAYDLGAENGAVVATTRTEPVVELLAPTGTLKKRGTVRLRVTDETRLWEVTISVKWPWGAVDTIFAGGEWNPNYSGFETITSNLVREYSFTKLNGWPVQPNSSIQPKFIVTSADAN